MLHNLCSQNLAKQLRESSSLPLWGADQLRRGHSHYPGHPGRLHGHITGAHLRHSQRRLGVGGLKDNWVKGKQEAHLVRPEPNIPSYHFSSQIWPALPTSPPCGPCSRFLPVPWHTPAQCSGLRCSASTASSLAPCCKQSQREAEWSITVLQPYPLLAYPMQQTHQLTSTALCGGKEDHGSGQLLGKPNVFLADDKQP